MEDCKVHAVSKRTATALLSEFDGENGRSNLVVLDSYSDDRTGVYGTRYGFEGSDRAVLLVRTAGHGMTADYYLYDGRPRLRPGHGDEYDGTV